MDDLWKEYVNSYWWRAGLPYTYIYIYKNQKIIINFYHYFFWINYFIINYFFP
jgi:hypothetical protein